ncbi:P-loop containing nucleoside triphosphate hydrolase protein [Dichotomopilus funicola]|uniref:P-loop containing nucleoside triphosphate hydrolase protein n=1 Tax=Dichotomopilus funicola TaxID=1934379 RepID=A0AAN6UVN1_9PEZI|nr:P-loop containing nucleoside triphosphate hydrolase protein [Dichotomopilus funicola]
MRRGTSEKDEPKREGRGRGGLWELLDLKKMVTSAKGRATEVVVDFIKNNLLETKLIFVFGKTGAGKSTLLRELTGMDVKVGNTLNSGTRNYEICPGYIHDEKYIFIDTPGFGAADMNNEETMKDIASCLMVLGPFVTIAGALFVYDAGSDRLGQDEERTIRWLQCFCGPDFFRNITVVITKWDKLSPKAVTKAQGRIDALLEGAENDPYAEEDSSTGTTPSNNSLSNLFYPHPPYVGAHIYHHGLLDQPTPIVSATTLEPLDVEEDPGLRCDRAKDMIHRRYASTSKPPARLQIQQEMDEFTPLGETQAMKVLKAGDMTRTRVGIDNGRAVVVTLPTRDDNDDDDESSNNLYTPGTDDGALIPVSVPASDTTITSSKSSSKTVVANVKNKDRADDNEKDNDNKAVAAQTKWMEDVGAKPEGGRFWEWFGIAGKMAMFFSQAVGQGFAGMAMACVEEVKKWFS